MPEGDTVWLTANRLDRALSGRVVTEFELRVPRLALSDLTGATVTEVVSRGKHILMRFDNDHTLHSHLRMDGSWQIHRPSARAAASAPTYRSRADLRRADAGAVGPRRRASSGSGPAPHASASRQFDIRAVLGNAEWRATGHRIHDLDIARTSSGEPWVAHLGPDLLGPGWDPTQARRNLREQPDRRIVEALLDQRNLAGIGNMYAAELLFIVGINPYTTVAQALDAPPGTAGAERGDVMTAAYRLLRANRDHPEQSTTGRTERGEQHWVYLRAGQPCRRCRTPISSATIGTGAQERTTYWCPRCQPAAE